VLRRFRASRSAADLANQRSRNKHPEVQEAGFCHYCILKNVEWRDIWRESATAFGVQQTSRSVVQMRRTYYRTREEWGMGYVTKSGSAGSTNDMVIVKKKMSKHTTCSSPSLRPKGC